MNDLVLWLKRNRVVIIVKRFIDWQLNFIGETYRVFQKEKVEIRHSVSQCRKSTGPAWTRVYSKLHFPELLIEGFRCGDKIKVISENQGKGFIHAVREIFSLSNFFFAGRIIHHESNVILEGRYRYVFKWRMILLFHLNLMIVVYFISIVYILNAIYLRNFELLINIGLVMLFVSFYSAFSFFISSLFRRGSSVYREAIFKRLEDDFWEFVN